MRQVSAALAHELRPLPRFAVKSNCPREPPERVTTSETGLPVRWRRSTA